MKDAFFDGIAPTWLADWANVPDGHKTRLTDGDDSYRGGNGGEYILGLKGDDGIGGGNGDDVIRGGGGDDGLLGFQGDDRLDGGNGADSLRGGAGRDDLLGGAGDDQLAGDSGADIINGGLGSDNLIVNNSGPDGGRDVVVFNSVEDSLPSFEDQVSQFQPGEDKFDLSAIDAIAGTPENDAFTFIGRDAFSGAAGELRFDGTFVRADVNGDGEPDFSFRIVIFASGGQTLHANDFVL